MEKFNVKNVSFDREIEIFHDIFTNMKEKHKGNLQAGLILSGDPGVGKTSFIKMFSKIMGLELIVIETPHLVEEHIINIPFIVFSHGQENHRDMNMDVSSQQEFEVKLAKSSLYTSVSNAKKISDSALLVNIYKDDNLPKLWEALEGDAKTIPHEIMLLRQRYDCILFLDEFFRQTSMSIRNMLRSILDGQIGNHNMPANVYTIYASNMDHEGGGLERIPLNTDFSQDIEFTAPNRDVWFTYLTDKFKKDQHVKLNTDLIDEFYDLMGQKTEEGAQKHSLSQKDLMAEVRTSPRRWEQLLLYINSSLPIKDAEDATQLLTNVRHNFRHYQTGKEAEIASAVTEVVSRLIKKTSNLDIHHKTIAPAHGWRETLKHQIQQKIKLGEHRKYIPVLSGLPGTGKTSHIQGIADELNMVAAYVRVDQLQPEDVIGIPLSKGNNKDIEVKFSEPPLYDKIMRQLNAGEAHLAEKLKKHYSPEEAKAKLKEFKDSSTKYIIFFDELNRPSTEKVFNGLRRVILEQSFNDQLKLPKGTVIVAAINPHDHGTIKITDHLLDVMDIIPVGMSWNKGAHSTKKHLEGLNLDTRESESGPTILSLLDLFIEKFRVKEDALQGENHGVDPHFFLNIGSSPAYISGREYQSLYVTTTSTFDRALIREMKNFTGSDNADEVEEIENRLRKVVARVFKQFLSFNLKKNLSEAPEFMNQLEQWFLHSPDIMIGEAFQKKATVLPFSDIVDEFFKDPKKDLYEEPEFINYMKMHMNEPHKFAEDIQEYLEKELKADMKREHEFLLKKNHPKKSLQKDKIKFEKDEITKVEHFVRELVHAIKRNNLGNEMIAPIVLAIKKTLAAITDDTQIQGFLHLNHAIGVFVRNLSRET